MSNEGVKLIKDSKIHVDSQGGGRLYIPKEIMEALGWKSKKTLLLKASDGRLSVLPESEVSA